MPELPEVETTRRGIESHVVGRSLQNLIVRDRRLRWPVPAGLEQTLAGQHLRAVERRAKYLLFRFERGTLMLHLGMSGSLRVLLAPAPPDRHDHIDMVFGPVTLRYTDPRRFGSVHWLREAGDRHALLDRLGPEPLSDDFNGAYLHRLSRGRKAAIKVFIMDSAVVVGVGNIYASESLHAAGIDPRRAAGKVSRARYDALAGHIKTVLARAIEAGGTTLRDFVSGEGRPGYFAQELLVYGRAGEPCKRCGGIVRQQKLGQRATYFCPACQR